MESFEIFLDPFITNDILNLVKLSLLSTKFYKIMMVFIPDRISSNIGILSFVKMLINEGNGTF